MPPAVDPMTTARAGRPVADADRDRQREDRGRDPRFRGRAIELGAHRERARDAAVLSRASVMPGSASNIRIVPPVKASRWRARATHPMSGMATSTRTVDADQGRCETATVDPPGPRPVVESNPRGDERYQPFLEAQRGGLGQEIGQRKAKPNRPSAAWPSKRAIRKVKTPRKFAPRARAHSPRRRARVDARLPAPGEESQRQAQARPSVSQAPGWDRHSSNAEARRAHPIVHCASQPLGV